MQVDGTNYGIIPDTFSTILSNYLTPLQTTFPNATSINSPVYAMAYVSATMDQLLQSALQSLWNSINANTAQGLGLNILASTVLNLTRSTENTPSYTSLNVSVNPIYSVTKIQMTVTAISGGAVVFDPAQITPIEAHGTLSPAPPYKFISSTQNPQESFTVLSGAVGIYYFYVLSLDTTTPIPANTFNNLTNVTIPVGVTFNYSITNPSPSVLGSLTIPTTWKVGFPPTINSTTFYSPNFPQTIIKGGLYNFLVYSQDITTVVDADQLTSAPDDLNGYIGNVYNPYGAVLGSPPLTDAQFSAKRRYYLNVEGQTYYGLEKSIIDLNITSLTSLFIAETIVNEFNDSVLIVELGIDTTAGPVTIPMGWSVTTSTLPAPSPAYATVNSFVYTTTGTYYIPLYSNDTTHAFNTNTITGYSPAVVGITSTANLVPAVLGGTLLPSGLGKRGYTVYLDYPFSQSMCVVQITVSAVGASPPYTIPIGWQATGPTTSSPYLTLSSYSINAPGTYDIVVYSYDILTAVGINQFTGGALVSGLTFTVNNSASSVLGIGFDSQDPNLQTIAQTCYNFHPIGTQFYAAVTGACIFTVPTPYSGYNAAVTLNPFQTRYISCSLKVVYNSDPEDAGYSNGVFDTSILPTFQTTVLELINQYFLSKTLPTDMVYSINELTTLIQAKFTGIVALVGSGIVYSICRIEINVSVLTGGSVTLFSNLNNPNQTSYIQAAGFATTKPYLFISTPQAIQGDLTISATGIYHIYVLSEDITTPVPASSFNALSNIYVPPGVTFTYTITNPADAVLGSDSVSADYFSFGNIPPQTLQSGLLYLRRPLGYNFQLLNEDFYFSYVDKDVL